MYYCKIFVLFVYVYLTLISDVYCTGARNGGKKNEKNGNSASGSLGSGSTTPNQQGEGSSNATSGPVINEVPLDMNSLKRDDERGLYNEYSLDDWKITTLRTYVAKNFNKLKLNNTDLWPEELTKQSIYELLVFNKDKKYLILVTALKPEGYLSTQFVHFEEDTTDPSRSKPEILQENEFYTKFQQLLDNKFIEPYPKGLPKHFFYQKYQLFRAKSSDPTAGSDLDII